MKMNIFKTYLFILAQIACVLGGTGETGKRVIDELRKLDIISRIDMLTRREVDLSEG